MVKVDATTLLRSTNLYANFNYRMFCRYEVNWPMDSTYGDQIKLNVIWLRSTEIIVALGKTFDAGATR